MEYNTDIVIIIAFLFWFILSYLYIETGFFRKGFPRRFIDKYDVGEYIHILKNDLIQKVKIVGKSYTSITSGSDIIFYKPEVGDVVYDNFSALIILHEHSIDNKSKIGAMKMQLNKMAEEKKELAIEQKERIQGIINGLDEFIKN